MKTNEENSEFIIGRHPAMAALKSDQEINKVFIQKGLKTDAIAQLVKSAKERHLVISNVPKTKLDQMTAGQNHQGWPWPWRRTNMPPWTTCLKTRPKRMRNPSS